MDTLSKERRSWNMSRIRSRDTGPERAVRSILHGLGYRFRLCRKDLPGRPDIVLPRYKSVVFVHGCFWHRHPGCNDASTPKSRVEFWMDKFDANVKRDRKVRKELRSLGWKVNVVWACEVKQPDKLTRRLQRLLPK